MIIFLRSLTSICTSSSEIKSNDVINKKSAPQPTTTTMVDIDIFEILNLMCFSCIILFFFFSVYDRFFAVNAELLRVQMRTSNEKGYYPINFGPSRTNEQVLLVASLLLVLQVFRYLQFFSSLSLVNGACNELTWALLSVVFTVFIILILFSCSGMFMFSDTTSTFSTFTLAFITLCRSFFGTFDFDEAYSSNFAVTFIFVTSFNWIAIVIMTVLSSAILIDGVRMQSEFETLQRRGLPPPIGKDYQKILKKIVNTIIKIIFYRYGCCKSPIMQDILYTWCSCRKWYVRIKVIRCCSWCRDEPGGASMTYKEAYERLQHWKRETENLETLYINFHDLKNAMRGTNRNRRIVDDAEVGKILTLCYIDPKLKGESYFRNTKEKNLYEKAEREGKSIFVAKQTEYMRSLKSLKEIFNGVQLMTLKNHSQARKFSKNMININDVIKLNEQKLETVRMRFQSLKGKRGGK
jgi:hypothetical protein